MPIKDTDNGGKQRKHFNATTLGKMVPVTPKYIFHGIKRFKFKQKVRFILNKTVLVMCCRFYYWPIIVADMIILHGPVNRENVNLIITEACFPLKYSCLYLLIDPSWEIDSL